MRAFASISPNDESRVWAMFPGRSIDPLSKLDS
jgi:hypothetical protein